MKKKLALALNVLSVCFFSASTSFIYAKDIKQEFDAKNIKWLEIENKHQEGDINISLSKDRNKALIRAVDLSPKLKCVIQIKKDGSTLKVKTENKPQHCKIDLFIEIPQLIDIRIESNQGNVSIDGTIGELRYLIGKGDLVVKNAEVFKLKGKIGSGNTHVSSLIKGDIDAYAGNGNFEVSGPFDGDKIDVNIGSGNVDLFLTKTKEKGKVNILIGSGNAALMVPSDLKITADLKTGFGKVENDLNTVPGSLFNVEIKVGAGNTRIKKN